ncbi:unnamed protein product [Rotaria sp. Silwood1]|nr:unnamed protein product [Rotaria sp. Silwood1]CAF1646585.1 unnamed protein product [Rotaria sp. Silwood1]
MSQKESKKKFYRVPRMLGALMGALLIRIWDHLSKISKNSQTTIIITIHYIEEARQADRVGLMRSGRMLAEDEPLSLLIKYNQTSLESVFLHLCVEDQKNVLKSSSHSINQDDLTNSASNTNNENMPSLDVTTGETPHSEIPVLRAKRTAVDSCICPHMHKIYALMVKDLTAIKRNIGFLIFQFYLPLVQISLFCLCIGRDPQHIPMTLYNSEAINGYPTGNLSLQLLSKINPEQIHFTPFYDLNQAIAAVKRGDYWGVTAIRFNFSEGIKNKSINFIEKQIHQH